MNNNRTVSLPSHSSFPNSSVFYRFQVYFIFFPPEEYKLMAPNYRTGADPTQLLVIHELICTLQLLAVLKLLIVRLYSELTHKTTTFPLVFMGVKLGL